MASIYEGRGKYQVKWRDPDGRQRSRTCPTKKAACDLKLEVEIAISLGHRWEPRDAEALPTLQEMFRKYLQQKALTVAEQSTVDRYALFGDLYLRFLLWRDPRSSLTVDLLSRSLLEDFHWWLMEPDNSLHGGGRVHNTAVKIIEGVELAWVWAEESGRWPGVIQRPRRLRLKREPPGATVAPNWVEMDAGITACNGWHRQLAVILRFTGLRVQQAMRLRWDDLDMGAGTLRILPDLGKSTNERRGRVIPVCRHLLDEVKTWERQSDWIINSNRARGGPRERLSRARDMRRAWERAGVPVPVRRQPHHCFRKGFITEMKLAGADNEAVEYYVGHSMGLRGVYTDPRAYQLQDLVDRIPALGAGASSVVDLERERQARGG
ncbi:MAG: site-specific integrase [Pseudomonadota bacterium]